MFYKIGIDTGGTFTDAVCVGEDGQIILVKVPSTPKEPSKAVIRAINSISEKIGADPSHFLKDVNTIFHGTTVALNAVLTKKGAKVGLITTKGFRDVLEIRRGHRWGREFDMWNVRIPFPEPFVPRYLRKEVEERVAYNGEVLTHLNENDVRKVARELKENKVESVAICFLYSFVNSDHEIRAAQIVKEEYPEVIISLSSNVCPIMPEFERTSTVVFDAYVSPCVKKYLSELNNDIRKQEFEGILLFVNSAGGTSTLESAIEVPSTMIASGPAAVAPIALQVGEKTGFENLITIDMGGTSFDVCLFPGGKVVSTSEKLIAEYPLVRPMLDVHTVGAGGGSIAWCDTANVLRVGPQSSGAEPGPACYGLGGDKPTVTDANLVLGYLNPNYFLGGKMKLDVNAAKKAIEQEVADKQRIDVIEAANIIRNVADITMANAMRKVSLERGFDPRDFAIVVGGGAGAVHATKLAEELNANAIIIPKMATGLCAYGMLFSDIRYEYNRTLFYPEDDIKLVDVNDLLDDMVKEAVENLRRDNVDDKNMIMNRSVYIRYLGQYRDVEISIPAGKVTEKTLQVIINDFHKKHNQIYSFSMPDRKVEFVTWRVSSIGELAKPKLKQLPYAGTDSSKAIKETRAVFFEKNKDFIQTPIYNGGLLSCGNIIEGPAVVEEEGTTIVIPPNYSFEIDEYNNFIWKREV